VREPLGKVSLAEPRCAEQKHRRELHGFVAGDGECEVLAQIVDDLDEIG